MKRSFLLIGLAVGTSFFVPTKSIKAQGCPNLNFSMGDFTNWQAYTGSCLGGVDTIYSYSLFPGRHTIMDVQQLILSNQLRDEYCDSIRKVQNGFSYAVKLGNDSANAKINALEYTMTVGSNNSFLSVHFAFVMENSQNQNPNERPKFTIQLRDSLGNPLPNFACGNIELIADTGLQNLVCTNGILAQDWTTVGYNLEDFIGQTIKIYFETRDCIYGEHFGYAYVVAECRPATIELQYCSSDVPSRMTAPSGYAWYEWTRSGDTSWKAYGRQVALPYHLVADGEIITITLTSKLGCKSELKVVIKRTDVDADFAFGVKDANGHVPIIENNLESWYDTCNHTVTFVDLSKEHHTKKEYILWEIMDPADPSGKRVLRTSTDSLFTFTFPDPDYNTPVTYRVRLTVYAENWCWDTSQSKPDQYITIYPSPKVKIEGENQICEGNPIWLNVKIFRGIFTNHTWSWTDTNGITHTSTGDSLEIYNSGTYLLVSEDIGGCFVRDTFIVSPIKPKFSSLDIWDVACYGEATGVFIHGTIVGAELPYSLYTWTLKDKNGNDSVVNAPTYHSGMYTNLKAGIYRFNVVDNRGCAMEGEVEIKQNDSLKITGEQFSANHGSNDGRLRLYASGGVPPYKYRVEKEDGTQVSTFNTASNLAAGIYRIFVTDAEKCVTSDTISVLEKPVVVGVGAGSARPEIRVFPNPTDGKIRITGYPISEMRLSDIQIFDIVGKLQESRISEIGKSEIVLDISHLASGLYFLKVDGKTVKIIKN